MTRNRNLLVKALILFITTLCTLSCDTGRQVDREAVQEEMENRKIRRVPTAELLAEAEQLGNLVSDTAQKMLQHALTGAIEKEGIAGAIRYCNLNAFDLVKKLEDSLGITIRRVSTRTRNIKNSPDTVEAQILEAYAYSPKDARPQVMEVDSRMLIYTKPISIAGGLCLNCHGNVGQQIQNDDYLLIKSLYPDDQAVGYQLHDLRGMWSLRIPRSAVVKAMDN